MRVLVTGATGYLGWRTAMLLEQRGHDIVTLTRPGSRARAASADLRIDYVLDAGDPAARTLVEGCDAVLHFAGVPDPARARQDPATAVRENVGTTVNLLEACAQHDALLVLPSTARAGLDPPPDPYGLSKRLGEEACRLHRARAVALRLTSVFGPGQVAWEGATGAIAAFAARALDGRPIAIPGDPQRTRDFLYVDDLVDGLERLIADDAAGGDGVLWAGSGVATPLLEAAQLAIAAAGADVEIELPGGELPSGEGDSYSLPPSDARLALMPRPLAEAVVTYVDWLRLHPAAQSRSRG
ncbi:MAG: UDP-glucose 4-epimerase [Solirubrobacteraceae bacterium]|jgi:UDP-glucose 4-epimerase|nr:UDP-glucose 4-epimerase [Solirubrobacteraceae bacterium]